MQPEKCQRTSTAGGFPCGGRHSQSLIENVVAGLERLAGAFAEAARRSVETCSAGRAGAHPYRRQQSGSALSFLSGRRVGFAVRSVSLPVATYRARVAAPIEDSSV